MLYRGRTERGDILPIYHKQSLLKGKTAVAELIKDRIRHHQGVWWEDPLTGYEGFKLLSQRGRENQTEEVVNSTVAYIRQTQGVEKVEKVQSTMEDRQLTISCDVVTKDNQTIKIGIRGGEDGIFQTLY